MTNRWWHRNWWALLAVPLLVELVLLSPDRSYETWQTAEPRVSVLPGADGWVSYAGGRFRLGELAPAELFDTSDEAYPVPAGLRAWQATVIIEPVDPDRLWGCELYLVDPQGRRFGDGPSELAGAYLASGDRFASRGCLPPDELDQPDVAADDRAGAPGAPSASLEAYQNLALFVLPESATPVALWLAVYEELPAYAQFEIR